MKAEESGFRQFAQNTATAAVNAELERTRLSSSPRLKRVFWSIAPGMPSPADGIYYKFVLHTNRDSTLPSTAQVIEKLVGVIGRNLTAYICNVRDVRSVDRWMAGEVIDPDAEERLRFSLQIVQALAEADDPSVVQSWLTGLNPQLGDRVPLRLLREGEIKVIAPMIRVAASAFLVGG